MQTGCREQPVPCTAETLNKSEFPQQSDIDGSDSMNKQALAELISKQKTGYALDHEFYQDEEIYQRDIERIYLKSWLYTGHQSEIPNKGDFFLYKMANEEVIVLRGDDGQISTLLNVCRHRGSRVCLEAKGSAKRLSCPYHGWTYDLDGKLIAAAHMDESFDKSGFRTEKSTPPGVPGNDFHQLCQRAIQLRRGGTGPHRIPAALSAG